MVKLCSGSDTPCYITTGESVNTCININCSPNLIFMSVHRNIIPNYARFLDLFIFTDALHVSGGSSAHHQEPITVHTASGIVNQYCC